MGQYKKWTCYESGFSQPLGHESTHRAGSLRPLSLFLAQIAVNGIGLSPSHLPTPSPSTLLSHLGVFLGWRPQQNLIFDPFPSYSAKVMYYLSAHMGFFYTPPSPFLRTPYIKPPYPNRHRRPSRRWRRNPLSFHPRHARSNRDCEPQEWATLGAQFGQNSTNNQARKFPHSCIQPHSLFWFCSLGHLIFKQMLISAGHEEVGVLFCKCMSLGVSPYVQLITPH